LVRLRMSKPLNQIRQIIPLQFQHGVQYDINKTSTR
jgi:hypothetical protein